MSIKVYWHDEQKTIIRIDYVGAWTLDDFYVMTKESTRMISEVDHPVDLLVDLRQSTAAPTKLLSTARYINELVQPNQRFTISIGAPTFIKALTKVAGRIAPKVTEKLYYTNTMDEAFAIIQKHSVNSS